MPLYLQFNAILAKCQSQSGFVGAHAKATSCLNFQLFRQGTTAYQCWCKHACVCLALSSPSYAVQKCCGYSGAVSSPKHGCHTAHFFQGYLA